MNNNPIYSTPLFQCSPILQTSLPSGARSTPIHVLLSFSWATCPSSPYNQWQPCAQRFWWGSLKLKLHGTVQVMFKFCPDVSLGNFYCACSCMGMDLSSIKTMELYLQNNILPTPSPLFKQVIHLYWECSASVFLLLRLTVRPLCHPQQTFVKTTYARSCSPKVRFQR